jgi:hypothetical protein
MICWNIVTRKSRGYAEDNDWVEDEIAGDDNIQLNGASSISRSWSNNATSSRIDEHSSVVLHLMEKLETLIQTAKCKDEGSAKWWTPGLD